jgi:hypothetical protein
LQATTPNRKNATFPRRREPSHEATIALLSAAMALAAIVLGTIAVMAIETYLRQPGATLR